MQRAFKRIIKARNHEQEHEKRYDIKLAGNEKIRADKRRCGYAEAQHKACSNDKHRRSKFGLCKATFKCAQLFVKAGKIALFGVVRAQIGHGLHALLNSVLAAEPCGH